MTEEPPNLDEVQQRLAEIQQQKRRGLRWGVSTHTAEMVKVVLESGVDRGVAPRSGKSRRRKRAKRLL